MKLSPELSDALFLRRLNRFLAIVEVAGAPALAHVPNSGRLREVLQPGARVLVAPRPGPRKTTCDLVMAWCGSTLVSVDARLPGRLVEEALRRGCLAGLGPFSVLRREVPLGASRVDLLGEGPGGLCYIEAKSVTLVEGRVALFPDAPTARGVRHLEELQRAAAAGQQAAVVFVIQREDADAFRPHERADPAFASALRAAARTVQVLAYRCHVTRDEVAIAGGVPVALD